jgi:hypothetical protein
MGALNDWTLAQNAYNMAKSTYYAADPSAQVAADQTVTTKYITDMSGSLAAALTDSINAGASLAALQKVAGPASQYTTNLQKQVNDLNSQQTSLNQQIRMQRRSFMDQFPQSSVGGYFFHHTADDFVLFVFLVGYLTAFCVVYSNFVTSTSALTRVGAVVIFAISWSAIVQGLLRFG